MIFSRRWSKAAAAVTAADPVALPPEAVAPFLEDDDAGQTRIRLSWVWSSPSHPDANLGDALSATVVSAIAGLPVRRTNFDDPSERLAAVGTIGHAQQKGIVHLWGTGFDAARDVAGDLNGFSIPPDTTFKVHAVRGRRTAELLASHGLDVPEAYGDPVWFLPRIFPGDGVEKTHDLGVIVHITELDEKTAAGKVRADMRRYLIPDDLAGSIRIINTYTDASLEGLRAKTEEMLSCRRLLSVSLHGLVIAETYGIPCAWFSPTVGGPGRLDIGGEVPIDHRMADFYSGAGRTKVLALRQQRKRATDWELAIRTIDEGWEPLDYTGRALFEAFPLPPAVAFDDSRWEVEPGLLESLPY